MKKLFLFCLLISSAIQAQQTFVSGYVVQLNGDTLRGEIKVNAKKEVDLFSKVTFKEATGGQKTFKPEKIKAYGFEDKCFISGVHDKDPCFYKVISLGAIELVEIQFESVNKVNETIVVKEFNIRKKGSDEYIRLKPNKFKKQVAELISADKAYIKEMEDDKSMTVETLADFIKRYNEWAKAENK